MLQLDFPALDYCCLSTFQSHYWDLIVGGGGGEPAPYPTITRGVDGGEEGEGPPPVEVESALGPMARRKSTPPPLLMRLSERSSWEKEKGKGCVGLAAAQQVFQMTPCGEVVLWLNPQMHPCRFSTQRGCSSRPTIVTVLVSPYTLLFAREWNQDFLNDQMGVLALIVICYWFFEGILYINFLM